MKDFLKSALKYCFPSVVSALIGFLVIPIVSHYYPTDEYGKINMFYSVGNMLMCFMLLGWDNAYIRYFNEPLKTMEPSKMLGLSNIIVIITGSILAIFTWCGFGKSISKYLFDDVIVWLIYFMILYSLAQAVLRMYILKSRMQMKAVSYNVKQIMLILATRLSFIFVLPYSTSFIPATIVMTISTFLVMLVVLFLDRKDTTYNFSNIEHGALTEIVKFALPTIPTTLIIYINEVVSKLSLSGIGAFDEVGIISVALSLSNVFSLLPAAFAIYWSAYMYKNYKTDEKQIKQIHNFICIISVIIILAIMWFQDILYFFVGKEYKVSQVYFMIIMLMPIQSLISETTSYGISIAKKTKLMLYISIITCITNIILCIVFVPTMGAMGAALGTGISAVICLILKSVFGQKYYKSITKSTQTIIVCALIALLCFLNFYACESYVLRAILTIGSLFILLFNYRQDFKLLIKDI